MCHLIIWGIRLGVWWTAPARKWNSVATYTDEYKRECWERDWWLKILSLWASQSFQQVKGKKTCHGMRWGKIALSRVALYRSQFCNGIPKKVKGNVPGDWHQISLAQGQSRRMCKVVSGDWQRGQRESTCWWPNARNVLVGRRFCIAFQRNTWIFLGQGKDHSQFHMALFQGTWCWWYKKVEADFTKQVPLLCGQRKVSVSWAKRATGIPWIRLWSWGGRGRLKESKDQEWFVHRALILQSSS